MKSRRLEIASGSFPAVAAPLAAAHQATSRCVSPTDPSTIALNVGEPFGITVDLDVLEPLRDVRPSQRSSPPETWSIHLVEGSVLASLDGRQWLAGFCLSPAPGNQQH
jgi:hypothetical protein